MPKLPTEIICRDRKSRYRFQKRRKNPIDWNSDAVKEILDIRDALRLSPLDTYREFVKRDIPVHYTTIQQRLHQMDVTAGRVSRQLW